MNYHILMDVSGDLAPERLNSSELLLIPMEYSLGGAMRTCASMETRETLKRFYDGQRNGDLTHTSQISPAQYQAFVEPYLKNGESILYLALSSGLSATVESARIMQKHLKKKYPDVDFVPVDTLAATGGMGVLAERALRSRESGMDIFENARDLTSAASRIQHIFVVQDLMYLSRGGRIGSAAARIGTALNIKPILIIAPDGTLKIIDKKRGPKSAVRALLDHFEAHHDPDADDVVYIIDADAEDLSAALEEGVRSLCPDAVIRHAGLSPIIGAHTGPGMAAICYMGREKQDA